MSCICIIDICIYTYIYIYILGALWALGGRTGRDDCSLSCCHNDKKKKKTHNCNTNNDNNNNNNNTIAMLLASSPDRSLDLESISLKCMWGGARQCVHARVHECMHACVRMIHLSIDSPRASPSPLKTNGRPKPW